jgi:hypothetical protein
MNKIFCLIYRLDCCNLEKLGKLFTTKRGRLKLGFMSDWLLGPQFFYCTSMPIISGSQNWLENVAVLFATLIAFYQMKLKVSCFKFSLVLIYFSTEFKYFLK